MFQAPDNTQTVSVRLSEALADIGVNERIVQKRRRTFLLQESMMQISQELWGLKGAFYNFGSQSEGTTTLGLNSDFDNLMCPFHYSVIQDWRDWQPGVINLLMIQDETVPPGYCLLRAVRGDVPLSYNDIPDEQHFVRDGSGRILLRTSTMSTTAATSYAVAAALVGFVDYRGEVHGPAYATQGSFGNTAHDQVLAYTCNSWPQQAAQCLHQPDEGQWPSYDIKRYCSNTGCFVVGVGSKISENEDIEWRISTSLAERCLMFNLNITQIRCYVLMKMILKTYIKPQFGDTISSFMCKTVLFHCISSTQFNIWRENNLILCLKICLLSLYKCILNENCPHFIIPKNNLMAGHISHESKSHILEIIQYIINCQGALLEIECDALGARLQLKLNNNDLCLFKTTDILSGGLLKTTVEKIEYTIWHCLIYIRNSSYEVTIRTLLKFIFKLASKSNQCRGLDKKACNLLASPLCTALGSVIASLNIQQTYNISAEAVRWISLGMNTDVSSSKLKLASMFYCIRDWQRTEVVLRDITESYDQNNVEPFCTCYDYVRQAFRRGFDAISDNHNEEALQYAVAFCVRFQQCEINCIPTELQYEMFRSTQEDLAFRGMIDNWMDWAVVDSLPFLYFLQYKTYSYLGRQDDKQRALANLIRTIDQEPNLGHRETALNLLGQCMEQEDHAVDALRCYSSSLNLRGRNNVAKIHICRLLSTLVNSQARSQSLN